MARVFPSSAAVIAARGSRWQPGTPPDRFRNPPARVRAQYRVEQGGAGLVHSTVAAPDDDEIGLVIGGAAREPVGMTGAGGEIDLTAQAATIELLAHHRRAPFRGVNVGACA